MKIANKIIFFFILIFFSQLSFTQQLEIIPHIETVKIDAEDSEWKNIKGYHFNASSDTSMEVNGDFRNGDLMATIKIAWNNNALYFYIEWKDDVIDERIIPKDSSTIKIDNVGRMDKMYFFDNLKIQLRIKELNYSSWFAPRTNAFQWQSLRERKNNKSNSLNIPKPIYKSITKDFEKICLEIKYPWESLKILPEKLEKFNLLLLINDTDTPNANMDQRMKAKRKYISLSTKAVLTN